MKETFKHIGYHLNVFDKDTKKYIGYIKIQEGKSKKIMIKGKEAITGYYSRKVEKLNHEYYKGRKLQGTLQGEYLTELMALCGKVIK